MPDWAYISTEIENSTGTACNITGHCTVGGGSISSAYVIESSSHKYFVKTNHVARLSMFEAEALGLAEIAGSNTIRVPQPVVCGTTENEAFLVMEHIPFGGGTSGAHSVLGEQLAAMHRYGTDNFGWNTDNTIGSTKQCNHPDDDWINFWRHQRLGFQLQLASENNYQGFIQEKGELLMECIEALFTNYKPAPSLLHGDLWSGNYAFSAEAEPVIFDPAVYYGDRETDIAMTELFGGFERAFYAAYNSSWPLDVGYPVRKQLYNLYHVLNHLNLFGGGYLSQAEHLIEALLAEIR